MSALTSVGQTKTLAEYLALESQSEDRHEYHNGEILAMSGGTFRHARVATNLTTAASIRLRGRPCQINDSNLRVVIRQSNRYVYPDASVVCDPPAFEEHDPNQTTLLNPRVVFEVLSPSTEGYDRGEKFAHYQRIPTLDEYVLISPDTPRVESLLRQDDGTWNLKTWTGPVDQTVAEIRCLPLDLPLAELYERVNFDRKT